MAFHNKRDSRGRFAPKNTPKGVATTQATNIPVTKLVAGKGAEKKLINHIAILLDSSGSMAHLQNQVIESFNAQVAKIKEEAYNTKQETYFTFWTFGEGGRYSSRASVIRKLSQVHIEQAPFLTTASYVPALGTPLVSCMLQAIKDLEYAKEANNPNTSFLVMLITDGEENESSTQDKYEIRGLIQRMQNTGRWTFTYAGPRGLAAELQKYGIPAGNAIEWEQTTVGVGQYTYSVNKGISNYYNTRSLGYANMGSGNAAHLSFFTPDFSNVTPQKLQGLQNFNNKFRSFVVQDQDCTGLDANKRQAVEISQFVQKHNLPYQISKGFYELTKTEEIQDHKELAIKNLKTGEIYGGREAKDLLKLPQGGTIKVKPSQHPDYKVFVQSTSMNRKLIKGQEFLYRIS